MASNKHHPESPWSPTSYLHFGGMSRRSSITSLSSRAALDRETVSQTLDDIHASASRSSALTAFNDFAPPPAHANADERPANGALGNFYSRFVTGAPKPRPSSASSHASSLQQQPQQQQRSTGAKTASRRLDGALSGLAKTKTDSHSNFEGFPDPSLARPPESAIAEPSEPSIEVAQHSRSSKRGSLAEEVQSEVNAAEPDVGVSDRQPRGSDPPTPLMSPFPGRARPRDSLRLPDSARTKSVPFASVTSLNVPASRTNEFDDRTDADSISMQSVAPSRSQSPRLPARPSNVMHASNVMHEMRRKVLSRDFWMKDENAKVCFSCGDAFTTFRRKHHCRTCGQIYDAKCTVLIPGQMFDQPGRLRICRTCENIIIGDESSDDLSEGDDQVSTMQTKSIRFSQLPWNPDDQRSESTTSLLKNPYDARRRTVGTSSSDLNATPLPRPGSSRSLHSMTSRPRSSSHKLRRTRHSHIRSLGTTTESASVLSKTTSGPGHRETGLPAFHTDAIVDPDIAPFMSDEGSSDEELQSMGSVLHDGQSEAALGSSFRKSRPRPMSSRSQLDIGLHDFDDAASINSSRLGPKRKRVTRTMSVGSVATRPGTAQHRIIRSENLFSESPLTATFPSDIHENALWVSRSAEPPATPFGEGIPSEAPSRRASLAELDHASMSHVKKLLKQLLEDGKITNVRRWKRVLLSILLRCAEDVDPNIQRGDDIDIRHYVKLKKAPGREPSDSLYISGVVFSKNIALKGMPRSVADARILILSFPIVYARHQNHFMSLDPVIAQEAEYLRNLVRRIVALRPSVVLVQRQVAGLALEQLKDAGLVVVVNVKESVLQAVARCTETRIIASVDKLTMDPADLGHCRKFEFKTLIIGGMRKTYAYVSGCTKDLGCTIVLRGAQVEELRKIKRITEFMAYVVYNLKLETSLIRDQFMTLSDECEDLSSAITMGQLNRHLAQSSVKPEVSGEVAISGDEEHGPLEYDGLVQDLRERVLSISPAVRLPPPYLLLKAQEQERQMQTLKDNLKKAEEMPLPPEKDLEKAAESGTEKDAAQPFELLQPEMIFHVTESTSEQLWDSLKAIRRAEYDRASSHFSALKRRWESYISGALDPFNPMAHQQIVVLYSVVSTPTSNACEGPDLAAMSFYQEHDVEGDLEPDVPLGEYIERLCDQAEVPCTTSSCDQLMKQHHRQYVHGEGQVSVHVKDHPSKLRGLENTILMWSVCRECEQETPVIPMSRNSWKFSFAKYLELTFWSRTLRPRTGLCPHDVQRNHVRFFGFNKLAVSIRYDPIRIMEVMVPKSSITWRVEKDVQLKNIVYHRIEARMKGFLSSVLDRINSISLQNVNPDIIKECRKELEMFRQRVKDDEEVVIEKLREKYANSKYYEVIPLNRALRAMQEKVTVWGSLFADFEHRFLPSPRDIRRLAAQRLKDVYLEHAGLAEATAIPDLRVEDEKQDAVAEDTDIATVACPDQLTPTASHQLAQNQPQVVQNLDLAVESLSPTSCVSSPSKQGPTAEAAEEATTTTYSDKHAVGRPSGTQSGPSSPPLLRSMTQPVSQQRSEESIASPSPSKAPPPAKAGVQSMIPVPSKAAAPLRQDKTSDKGQTPAKAGTTMTATSKGIKSSLQSMIPRSKAVKASASSRVSALARQFEKMSREFEREKLREREQRLARVRQTQVYSIGSYQPVMEVYSDAQQAVHEQEPTFGDNRPVEKGVAKNDNGQPDTREATEDSASVDNTTADNATTDDATVDEVTADEAQEEDELADSQEALRSEDSTLLASYPASEIEHTLSDTERTVNEEAESLGPADSAPEKQLENLDLAKHDKTSILKLLSSFWSERSASGWTDLEYPLQATEHIFSDSDVIPREDEPSSIIAFSLASDYYKSQLQAFRDRVREDPAVLMNPPSGETEIEQTLLGRTATHVSYTFPAGQARMRCKVFFAEAFDAIQQKCGVSERIVESLSRCFKFESKGGKTKSIFLKTLDERFVLKSLSQVETDAFLRFAPDYFDYMSKCLFHNLPSALAKMLGFYEVTIKNAETGVEFGYFLQLMENVFYEGPSNQTFDLKGSMRNRKVKSTGERDEVLLDENLLDYISSAPIYIRNHSNSQLASSISNDTLFCSKQNVMDYSLIVGLYDDRHELMVGIIDYIRTYTWDKKLESWIKDRGKNKPTVRSPKEYRNRFRASIPRYFPLAPSCWQIFGVQRTDQPPLAWWESLGHRTGDGADEDGTVATAGETGVEEADEG